MRCGTPIPATLVHVAIWLCIADGLRLQRRAAMSAPLTWRRLGEPVLTLEFAATFATGAAYFSGRWSKIARFSAVVDEAWEQRRHDSRPGLLTVAYISPMRVARPRRTTHWLNMRQPRRWGAVVVCCDYRMSESRGRFAMIRCTSRPAYNGLHLQSMLPRRWAQEAQPDNGKVKQIAVPAI